MDPNSSYLRGLSRRVLLSALAVAPAVIGPLRSTPVSAQGGDFLPSWNDGASKQSIINFVTRVTTQRGPDFVPVDQRIATFDNDGTLWIEQPMYVQLALFSIASRSWRRRILAGKPNSRSRPYSMAT